MDSQIKLDLYQYCHDDLRWYGLYQNDKNFRQYTDPITSKHPAKIAFKLVKQIILHLEKLGLISKEDRIIDFMAGTGRVGIIAELMGYEFIGIELESHFVDMINANRKILEDRTGRQAKWTIINGDSRKMNYLLGKSSPGLTGPNLTGITSPAYTQAPDRISRGKIQDGSISDAIQRTYDKSNHGKTEGQIANLKDVGIVSPPYGLGRGLGGDYRSKALQEKRVWVKYGDHQDQIGNLEGQTYLEAMYQIYKEAYFSRISPLVIITKNPTRNGRIRRLDLDTMSLLIKAGYKLIDYHQAMLFITREQTTLSGDKKKIAKGQLSFFKRLQFQRGQVVADHEDVIFAIIPEIHKNIRRND